MITIKDIGTTSKGNTVELVMDTNGDIAVIPLQGSFRLFAAQAVRSGGGSFEITAEWSLDAVTWVSFGSITNAASTLTSAAAIFSFIRFTIVSGGGADITISVGGIKTAVTGGDPWTPSELGGDIIAWYDANVSTLALATAPDPDEIQTMDDITTVGNDLAISSSGNRPQLILAEQNGLDIIRCLNDDDFMRDLTPTSAPTGKVDCVMFAVSKCSSDFGDSINNCVLSLGDQQGANSSIFGLDFRSDDKLQVICKGGGSITVDATPTSFQDTWTILFVQAEAGQTHSQYLFRFNGEELPATFLTADNQHDIDPSNLSLGGIFDSAVPAVASNGFIGDIGEGGIIASKMSLANIQKLEGYLAHRWFGAGGLNPLIASHPYKNFPPVV